MMIGVERLPMGFKKYSLQARLIVPAIDDTNQDRLWKIPVQLGAENIDFSLVLAL